MPPALPLNAFCDATIFTGDSMTENHALLVQDGKIIDLITSRRVPSSAQRIDCGDQILVPGFIDAQVNGGGNLLFNNDPTVATALAIASAHAAYGTTRMLLTCITDRPEVTQSAISATRAAREKSRGILGIHIEGPHLSIERRGVHNPGNIRPLDANDLALYKRQGDEIMLVTLAPENVSPAQIEALRESGVIISLGHTGASSDDIHMALGAGATSFTHLFNGMGGIAAREPGPAGIALDDRDSFCSIIADGHHVAPEIIRLAVHAKPTGKVFLVSDAMPPAATETPMPFCLYGETIRAANGRCVNSEGKLAGAAITMLDAVRYCVTSVGLGLEESLRMASTYPAAFLGLDKRLGRLLPGYEADIVSIDPSFNLLHVCANVGPPENPAKQ